MKYTFTLILISILMIFGGMSCKDKLSPEQEPPETEVIIEKDEEKDEGGGKASQSGGRVTIVDFTGKRWDITYAVREYGMEAKDFHFGLGPYAIRPILNPQMLSPGDVGYPDNSKDFLILGAILNGEARAYPLRILGGREVADDKFGNVHVAFAY